MELGQGRGAVRRPEDVEEVGDDGHIERAVAEGQRARVAALRMPPGGQRPTRASIAADASMPTALAGGA